MLSILVYNFNNSLEFEEYDLSEWSIFIRKNIKEYIRFTSHEICSRIDKTLIIQTYKYDYENKVVYFYCYIHHTKIIILITDNPYKPILKYLKNLSKSTNIKEECKKILTEYSKTEPIEKVVLDLNGLEEILVEDIEKLLERGENINDLIERTDKLSQTSKDFMKKSKQLNRCCVLI